MIIVAAAKLDTGVLVEGFLKGIWVLVTSPGFFFLLVVGFLFLLLKAKKSRIKGWVGEAVTKHAGLAGLDGAVYRSYHDLYLPRPDGKGTTQLDHVVVSPFGVCVIETKNFSGWLYGGAEQSRWTQVLFKKKTQIPNPLHQNRLHARALRDFLRIPETTVVPLVWMAGDAVFKTPVPEGVVLSGLKGRIQSHTRQLFSAEEVARINGLLAQLDQTHDRQSLSQAHRAQFKPGR